MRSALENGVERTKRERKNKSKVTQELVEKKKKREIFKNYKQEKKRVTYTNEERRETTR